MFLKIGENPVNSIRNSIKDWQGRSGIMQVFPGSLDGASISTIPRSATATDPPLF